MKWQDWLEFVEDGYCLLKGMADKIFVMGLSMGGILSLLFAAHQPVAGVVIMSVPYDLSNDPRLRFAKLLAGIVSKVGKGPADWHNLEAAKDHVEYPYLPTKGIVQLHDLLSEMRAALPKITAPVLLTHSRQDVSVAHQNADQIFTRLGSQDKQILWVENSGHEIPHEPDRHLAFKAADEFVQRVINTG